MKMRQRRVSAYSFGLARAQKGQALVEGVLALPLLLGIWLGIAHIGDLLHAASRAADLGRHHAFMAAARVDPLHPAAVASGIRKGSERVDTQRVHALTELGSTASGVGHARVLRREWLAHDPGLLRARAGVTPRQPVRLAPALAMPTPVLNRYTVIATGAAHSGSDVQAQERIGRSSTGWKDAASLSQRHGHRVADVMSRVDRPWRRPSPDFDWLKPWRGVVPEHLLHREHRGTRR